MNALRQLALVTVLISGNFALAAGRPAGAHEARKFKHWQAQHGADSATTLAHFDAKNLDARVEAAVLRSGFATPGAKVTLGDGSGQGLAQVTKSGAVRVSILSTTGEQRNALVSFDAKRAPKVRSDMGLASRLRANNRVQARLAIQKRMAASIYPATNESVQRRIDNLTGVSSVMSPIEAKGFEVFLRVALPDTLSIPPVIAQPSFSAGWDGDDARAYPRQSDMVASAPLVERPAVVLPLSTRLRNRAAELTSHVVGSLRGAFAALATASGNLSLLFQRSGAGL